MPSVYVPERCDVVWMDLNPQAGREQSGRRPVVVLSLASYNKRAGLAVVCPITSRAKGYPYEEAIPDGSPVVGVVLGDHVKSLDWRARRAEFIGQLAPEFIALVLFKIQSIFV